jgi:hypothetical protein
MKRRQALISAVLLCVASLTLAAPDARAQAGAPGSGRLTVPLLDTDTGDVVLTITRFVESGGDIVAVGTVTATQILGGTVQTVTQQVRIPLLLDQTTGTCEILNLVLGPLHLDLLGLVVDLNQLELDIVAEAGPGNLLGNLLCAVAGLLDTDGALAGIANLLNQILAALG